MSRHAYVRFCGLQAFLSGHEPNCERFELVSYHSERCISVSPTATTRLPFCTKRGGHTQLPAIFESACSDRVQFQHADTMKAVVMPARKQQHDPLTDRYTGGTIITGTASLPFRLDNADPEHVRRHWLGDPYLAFGQHLLNDYLYGTVSSDSGQHPEQQPMVCAF